MTPTDHALSEHQSITAKRAEALLESGEDFSQMRREIERHASGGNVVALEFGLLGIKGRENVEGYVFQVTSSRETRAPRLHRKFQSKTFRGYPMTIRVGEEDALCTARVESSLRSVRRAMPCASEFGAGFSRTLGFWRGLIGELFYSSKARS